MLAAVQPSSASSARNRSRRRKRPHVPPEQRKRVKIACENCRRFKLRCNGQTPCGRCAGAGRQCQYLDVQSQSTSRLSEGDQQDKLILLEQVLNKLHPDIPTDSYGLANFHSSLVTVADTDAMLETVEDESLSNANDVNHNDDQLQHNSDHDRQRDNVVPVDACFSKTPITGASVTVVNQGKTHYEGESSYWSFFNSVRQVVTDDDSEADRNDEADCDGSIHQVSLLHFATDWKTAVLAALPPRNVVDFLVTTFFRFAQANYFYIHPEILSRKLTAFYDGTHEFGNTDAASSRRSIEFISVVFMVFAIGSQFAEVGSNYSDNGYRQSDSWADLSALELHHITVPVPSQNPGWRFYEVSRKLLPDIICSSSMASVQVCVLQGIFLPSTSSRDAGYNMLGLALRMAINMGMHRSFSSNSLHPHVRELRNRLWWSLYLAERLFSIEMGRPLSISDAEIDAPFPVNIPEWNIGGRVMNVDGLIAMAKLCRLLGKIVETIYCKPATEKDIIIRPKVFQQLKQELEQSRTNLPDHLKLTSSPTRTVAHLALTYEQGTILLTRSCLKYAAMSSQVEMLGNEARTFLHRQAQDCVNAAAESIRIMSLLKSQSLLCQFSFHDFLYCTAALYVLLLVKKLQGLVRISKDSINQGVLILLDLAKGSEAAASSLRHMIRIFKSCTKSGEDTLGTNSDLRGRMAWKAWMTQASPMLPNSQVSMGSRFSPKANIVSFRETVDDRDNVNNKLQSDLCSRSGQFITGYSQEFNGEHYSPPARIDGHYVDDCGINSPTTNDEHATESSDLQPFWIPEYADFDVLGRDLTGLLDLPNLA